MKSRKIYRTLSERFGDPIGSYAGDAPVGVRSIEEDVCSHCGMMAIDGQCGCEGMEVCPGCGQSPCRCGEMEMFEGVEPCKECGMLEVGGSCGCTHMDEAQEGGPSPKTAKKILRGTKSFKEKMKKVSGWAEDPAAAAAWMMHRATGKWPREK